MNPLLTVHDLSYHHNNHPLLHEVSLTLHGGQKVVLLGRSGSGKSLLLKALADLLPLDTLMTNRIMLNKNGTLTSLTQIPPAEYRHRVALFHQTPNLIDGTVLDNLQLPFTFKYHQHQRFHQDWHISRLVQLGKDEGFLNKSIHTLSGGECQLVSFLRTLQLNPTIALFDEATSALDDETADVVMRQVSDWHDDTKALIWVTHDTHETAKFHADVWQMDKGVLTT